MNFKEMMDETWDVRKDVQDEKLDNMTAKVLIGIGDEPEGVLVLTSWVNYDGREQGKRPTANSNIDKLLLSTVVSYIRASRGSVPMTMDVDGDVEYMLRQIYACC